MANPNAPSGLQPVRHLGGGEIRPNEYTIADTYGTALLLGDPVVVTGTGRDIGRATAGSSGIITGVFQGCHYIDTNGDVHFSKRWPASQAVLAGTRAKAYVLDDPKILYRIQMDTMAEADVRLLTDLVSGSGSTVTGLSAFTAAGVAGSENQLKIYGLWNGFNNGGVQNAYGAYAVAEVLIANHEFSSDMTEV